MHNSQTLFCISIFLCINLNLAACESALSLSSFNSNAQNKSTILQKRATNKHAKLQKQAHPSAAVPELAISPTAEITETLSQFNAQSPISEDEASASEQQPSLPGEQRIKPSRKRQREERLSHAEIVERAIVLAVEQRAHGSRAKQLPITLQTSPTLVKAKRQKTASEELIKIAMKALADKVTLLQKSSDEEKAKVATLEKNQLALMWVINDMQKVQQRLLFHTQPSPMLPVLHEPQPAGAINTLTRLPEELSCERFANTNPFKQNGLAEFFVQ